MGGNNILVPQQVQGETSAHIFQTSSTDITNLLCQVSWLFSWIEQEERGKVAEQGGEWDYIAQGQSLSWQNS